MVLNFHGLLHKPQNNTDKVIIAIHGMQSNCLKKRDDFIAKKACLNNIAYFCFSNRGHDLVNSITKIQDGKAIKMLSGSSLENIDDCYYDIKSAILEMQKLGYNNIYLQGHSLGCTKIIYTMTKLKNKNEQDILNKIKAVMLISLVDLPIAIKFFFQNDINKLISQMEDEKLNGNGKKLMSVDGAIIPMCPDTFLNFVKYNEEIDFAKFRDESYDFKELNDINVPLFMRWGNKNELIMQDASKLVSFMRSKIKNKKCDINYIDGASHNYKGKEEILASELISFLMKL